MKVYCNECGYQGEMDDQHFSHRIQCPKCGLLGLERSTGLPLMLKMKKIDRKPIEELATPVPSNARTPPQTTITDADIEPAVKEAETIVWASGRDKVKELVRQGMTFEQVAEALHGQLLITTIWDYYRYDGKDEKRRQRGNAIRGNKNAKGNRTGVTRHCVDCGAEIYVTRSRLEHAKNENVGRRCLPCSNRFILRTRKLKGTKRRTVPAITRKVIWLRDNFNDGEPSQFKDGAKLACALIIDFLESFKR